MIEVKLPAKEMQVTEEHRGKWVWCETASGERWMCYWDGGPTVSCYGRFYPKRKGKE